MSKKIFKYHDVIFLLYHPHLVYRYLWLEWTLMKMILAKTNTKKNIFGHILFVDMYYDLAYGTRGGVGTSKSGVFSTQQHIMKH